MSLILKAYTLSQCMEVMAEQVAARERAGERNLIFCEDRLTLLAERALLKATGGSFFSSVSTFARYLRSDKRTISKQGSVMAVGEVMTRLQRENILQCFTSATSVGNNAKCIYETLAQLSASEVTPEILQESLALLPDDILRKKVHDLAAIYEGYNTFLSDNAFLDESQFLKLLPEALRKTSGIENVNVFFLCFNSFTAQAARVIQASLESAKNVIGIFCGGEASLYTNEAVNAFTRVCAEHGRPEVRECGSPLSTTAERLRRGLFDPENLREEKTETDQIRLYEAEDKTAEAEYVATQIRRALAENRTLRYRDISVLTSDIGGYSLALKKAFSEYGIPYFIDEKKSLKRHPLSCFLLDCFKTVRERFSPSSVQSLTQNYFFGESDDYRNYLLKYANYRGGAKRALKRNEQIEASFDVAALESGRERLLLATKNIKSKDKGGNYCNAVREILTAFQVEQRLDSLGERLSDISQKGYLSQIYRALERVLEEAELLTVHREMTVAEFEAVLADGLDATEISLIPLKADAVFIGDVTDSRIERCKILFAIGMTDGVPRIGSDTAIISDKEIARLDEVRTRLEPTVAEVNLRSRESACLNLCAFTDALHLSYSLAADGSDPVVSEIFYYIDKLFCAVGSGKKGKLVRRKTLSEEEFRYKCSAPAPAIRQLLIEKDRYELCREDTRRTYSSLYTALDKLGVQEKDDYLAERGGQVCVERGEELFFHDGKISPTALENYFACPFKHFAERGLKLKQREETAVLALDTGNFIHDLLQAVAEQSKTLQTDEELHEFASKKGAELLGASVYAVQQDTDSGNFFSEKLLAEGVEVALAMFRQIKGSSFEVDATEKNVSSEFFRGKVDRMDSTDKYVRIIDYKTGSIDDSAASYYTGRKLQMQLYMSELKDEKIPAGVFYFPASVSYSDSVEEKFRMKGFLNSDRDALLCGDKQIKETEKSPYFSAALNNPRAEHVMDEATFRDFLDYSVYVARQGCEELKDGYIAPSPYEGSCKYCRYGGICGFRKDAMAERSEGAVKPAQIASIAREQREGGDDE